MLVKTGLAVISNPTHLSGVLKTAKKQVQNLLYVQLISMKLEPLGNLHVPWPSVSQAVNLIYSQASKDCQNLDVRVLLTTLKYEFVRIKTQRTIDLVIFDRDFNKRDIDTFLNSCMDNVKYDYNVFSLKVDHVPGFAFSSMDQKIFRHVVVGGTFDHLHLAHKLLLSEAALRSHQRLTVGVTEEKMLEHKVLSELIEPLGLRMRGVAEFLKDVCPDLDIDVVPISDPLGPAKSDRTMEMLVVSAETVSGGARVNEARLQNGLDCLSIFAVDLMPSTKTFPQEEAKISSSTARMRLLGELLIPLESNYAPTPYIIGLTGGIASGKSTVSKRLHRLGAHIINCDEVGHQVYVKGSSCYRKVRAEFGPAVIADNGEIDRRKLGNLVFKDKDKLQELNKIVWPAIEQSVTEEIGRAKSSVIVIEAAVLFLAKWEDMCHEVWATILPKEEAVRRIVERNHMTTEQALERINAQPSSKFYATHAHVVLCTLWDEQCTRMQVDKAWELLHERLHYMRKARK